MSSWFERFRQRQQELASGVDADLARGNRRRFRRALGLIGMGFVLAALGTMLNLSGTLRMIAIVSGIAMAICGGLMAEWASAERRFLDRPDPQEPPRLFKK